MTVIGRSTGRKLSKLNHSKMSIATFAVSLKTLIFPENEDLPNPCEANLNSLGHTLQKLPNLTSLSLEFDELYSGITNQSLIAISGVLKGLKQMNDLTLEFNDCYNLNNLSLFEMMAVVSSLRRLESLTIKFKDCKFLDDSTLSDISESISCLSNLRSFHINYDHKNNITHLGLS